MRTLRLALSQINPTVGDLKGNAALILKYVERALALQADLVVFPELVLCGYPPEDLLLRPSFVQKNSQVLGELAQKIRGISALIGFVDQTGDVYNACALVAEGKVIDIYRKIHLPNYGVFDEKRYFQAGKEYPVYELGETRVGVNICEDIWFPEGPARIQSLVGEAEVVINISSSPFEVGKLDYRRKMLSARAADNQVYLAYLNLVGGQDELVFDGQAMVLDPSGRLLGEGEAFREDLLVFDLDLDQVFHQRLHNPRWREMQGAREGRPEKVKKVRAAGPRATGPRPPVASPRVGELDPREEIYRALALGTRDYVRKNGFSKVTLGLSGGVDSALTAAIAVEALGSENVFGILMPSVYTARESVEGAEALARNLSIRTFTLPISRIFQVFQDELKPVFRDLPADLTEENLQARIRGNLLMALSNKFNWLVLTTGNKSEYSVGYSTLYGDMAGGFAVIKDISKTLVWQLSEYVNERAGREIIPRLIITRPPTAELRHNQKDEDSIPPYRVLDKIIKGYLEEDKDLEELVGAGLPREMVEQAIRLSDRSEYKRRQAAPGVKITPRALGKDRRMPLTNRFD
ncbi:MAG: NAD+ synthase [bacterium]|nr:NAD+ synthase [bacterium]